MLKNENITDSQEMIKFKLVISSRQQDNIKNKLPSCDKRSSENFSDGLRFICQIALCRFSCAKRVGSSQAMFLSASASRQ